jgi:hypothetical protein
MRGAHLHLMVPRRQQGARATLVQHGGVRQPGEGGGASGPHAIRFGQASQPADKLNGRNLMARGFLDVAGTPSVKAAQAANGVVMRSTTDEAHTEPSRLTAAEAQFIAACDSFYLASVSETGWPYVQHRGGPPGFLRVIDDSTFAFADFRGNRQNQVLDYALDLKNFHEGSHNLTIVPILVATGSTDNKVASDISRQI